VSVSDVTVRLTVVIGCLHLCGPSLSCRLVGTVTNLWRMVMASRLLVSSPHVTDVVLTFRHFHNHSVSEEASKLLLVLCAKHF